MRFYSCLPYNFFAMIMYYFRLNKALYFFKYIYITEIFFQIVNKKLFTIVATIN